MTKGIQGYILPLLEEEKNLLGMLLNDVQVPGKYAAVFVGIQRRFNAMKLEKIGEEIPAAKKRPTAPKAHPSVKAKPKKKKRTR